MISRKPYSGVTRRIIWATPGRDVSGAAMRPYGDRVMGWCGRGRSAVVATLAAFALTAAVGPADARAYFDQAEGGYDIDVHVVGMGAVYEDHPDAGWLLDRHASLGPHGVRQGWRITTPATAIDGLMAKYRNRGLRPLVVGEFLPGGQAGTQQIPTDSQVAGFCRDVSERFGPGGSGGMTAGTAIQYIELGNETTLDPRIKERPEGYAPDYARRIRTCAQNLQRGVKVLAQGPSHYATYASGHSKQTWIKSMYAAVPDLNSYRGGWTIHPYGPDNNELDNLQADLAPYDATGEYFLTEYGIATDDGRGCLGYDTTGDGKPDNTYNDGWDCRTTYSQAAQGFKTTIERWKDRYPRIRALWWYQIADQRDPGADTLREHYYGLFQNGPHGRAKEPLKSMVERYVRDLDEHETVSVGLFDRGVGRWHLSNNVPVGGASPSVDVPPFQFGSSAFLPVTGDWDGDGTTTIGLYHPSTNLWYRRNNNSPVAEDMTPPFKWGVAGDQPVTGDWDGDGKTTIGVYRPSTGTWYLRNNSTGAADIASFRFGYSTDRAVTGDWDGDGKTTIGVYRPSTGTWYLSNSNTSIAGDIAPFKWGLAGDQAVTGDWNGDGKTTVGVYRPSNSTWYLRAGNGAVSEYITPFRFGNSTTTIPVTGDWDGSPIPPQRCDKTQSSAESFPAFIARLGSSEHGCLVAGKYDLTSYDPSGRFADFKAGQVVKAKANGDGRRQAVTVQGELLLDASGVRLEDFTVVGTTNHAAIDMRAHNLTLRQMNIDSRPHKHDTQGVIIGGPELQIQNAVIEGSQIHNQGDTPNFDHGIYCQNTASGRFQGNWIYDNTAYGLHMYTNCDGIDVANNVVSDNGLGIVVANDTSGTTVRNGVVAHNTDVTRERGIRTSALVGAGNFLRDHAYWQVENYLAGMTVTNFDNEDPKFVDRKARDYRLQAGSPSREELGTYADAVPGPRT